jgi:hypothetical protein
MSLSDEDLEKAIEKAAEARLNQHISQLIDRFYIYAINYLNSLPRLFKNRYGIAPTMETRVTALSNGFEIHMVLYIDPETMSDLKKIFERQVRDEVIRAKSYMKASKGEISLPSDVYNALSSIMHSTSAESAGEAGLPGAEVRDEKRGHSSEGAGKSP